MHVMSAEKVGAVLVVGAGIAGIQASLDLAESGYYVYLVEQSPAIGGTMPMLDKTFPTNDCSMCILSPKLVECGRHLNIKTITCADVVDVQGEPGNFIATIKQRPRFVDVDKCKGCGECSEACPTDVPDEFNQSIGNRQAIYKPYAQAFPNAYMVDKENCIECESCIEVCQADAIDLEMEETTFELNVGAVILCPGFETYDASALFYYGYGKFPNVLTSLEFERVLSASGPFQGHMVRPFDHQEPKKIAWIQCVGSRNKREEHGYCSSVCCMYAVKEAVIAKEHSKDGLDATIFFMDMRTYGKGFEKYYERAKSEYGVKFVRSRIFEVSEINDESKNLSIRYADENGTINTEEFDLVVLSVGLQPSKDVIDLGNRLGLKLNEYGFCDTAPLSGVGTSRPGIFVAGAFGGPKDIPETVLQASAAAGASASLLGDVKGTLTKEVVFPPEKDVTGEDPRIGVFVCDCGINIAGTVKVPEVVEVAKNLPHVVYSGEYLYVCSQDSQAAIKEAIDEHQLNRVVVASCSPRTHKGLFQETCKEAGLNRYLFEMANIRDQCSWVHQGEPEKATEKAKDLVKMIVAKSAELQPIKQSSVGVTKAALIIGGGISGMTSALSLADLGFEVHLMEKSDQLGGMAKRISEGFRGEDVKTFVTQLVDQVEQNELIKVYKGAELKNVSGYVGNFITTLADGREIKHGVTIIAVGGREYKPTEYLYGESDLVMTQLETEEAVANKDARITSARNIVFIQCVGSREPGRNYCSRVCCNKSVKLALKMKEMNPGANIFVLYRDIRTYGFMEDMYREARQKGVIFIRYTPDNKPQVEKAGDKVVVTVTDHVLGVPIAIEADLLSLAAAVLPAEDNPRMNQLFKVPLNEDGFFLEAHMKLRPVDFSSEGVFMAGVAHGPKNIEENLGQAKAAAARACTILSKDALESHGVVAVVQPDKCAACLTCVRLCPYGAPRINNYAAEIESVLCQGCGSCAGECPNKAITLQGYNDKMFMKMMDGLFKEVL
jgi:heterodisulfide reductase subunit A